MGYSISPNEFVRRKTESSGSRMLDEEIEKLRHELWKKYYIRLEVYKGSEKEYWMYKQVDPQPSNFIDEEVVKKLARETEKQYLNSDVVMGVGCFDSSKPTEIPLSKVVYVWKVGTGDKLSLRSLAEILSKLNEMYKKKRIEVRKRMVEEESKLPSPKPWIDHYWNSY